MAGRKRSNSVRGGRDEVVPAPDPALKRSGEGCKPPDCIDAGGGFGWAMKRGSLADATSENPKSESPLRRFDAIEPYRAVRLPPLIPPQDVGGDQKQSACRAGMRGSAEEEKCDFSDPFCADAVRMTDTRVGHVQPPETCRRRDLGQPPLVHPQDVGREKKQSARSAALRKKEHAMTTSGAD